MRVGVFDRWLPHPKSKGRHGPRRRWPRRLEGEAWICQSRARRSRAPQTRARTRHPRLCRARRCRKQCAAHHGLYPRGSLSWRLLLAVLPLGQPRPEQKARFLPGTGCSTRRRRGICPAICCLPRRRTGKHSLGQASPLGVPLTPAPSRSNSPRRVRNLTRAHPQADSGGGAPSRPTSAAVACAGTFANGRALCCTNVSVMSNRTARAGGLHLPGLQTA